ncbi:hypothetical protein N431DRAFT_491952 [Stipitochalara longipes BDJ]|nr:hypothetical protein N431DRAFT_491952 [Stipitochalara longipes BDJ]
MVSIANSAQFVTSVLYFLYNGIYTSIASVFEWARFTTIRKALRTTEPRGLQSLLLHWLASEAFHYQRILVVDTLGRATKSEQKASALGIYDNLKYLVLLALFGAFIIYLTILLGLQPLPGVLLVGPNSLAISAACHPPVDDRDAAFIAVQWGAVRHETEEGPGHCCFSSHEVEIPQEGETYE